MNMYSTIRRKLKEVPSGSVLRKKIGRRKLDVHGFINESLYKTEDPELRRIQTDMHKMMMDEQHAYSFGMWNLLRQKQCQDVEQNDNIKDVPKEVQSVPVVRPMRIVIYIV